MIHNTEYCILLYIIHLPSRTAGGVWNSRQMLTESKFIFSILAARYATPAAIWWGLNWSHSELRNLQKNWYHQKNCWRVAGARPGWRDTQRTQQKRYFRQKFRNTSRSLAYHHIRTNYIYIKAKNTRRKEEGGNSRKVILIPTRLQ